MKKQSGITLVALVITVIILLILATVSISLLINNGILDKAKYGIDKYSEQEEFEQVQLAVTSAYLKGKGSLTTENLNSELQAEIDENETAQKIGNNWHYKDYIINENGKVEKTDKILPKEFHQVKYIESSGTQYFLLENVTTADFGFDIELYVLNNTGANVFGGFQLNGDKFCYMGTRYNKISFFCDYNPNFIDFCSTQYLTRHEYRFINNNNNKSFFYDDNLLNKNNFTNNSNCLIAVFSFVDSNKVVRSSSNETFKGRIYKFIIYDKNNEQCNLVPCYTTTVVTDVNNRQCSEGTIGMYDLVKKKFYTNQGTGTFGYGMEDGTYVAPTNN